MEVEELRKRVTELEASEGEQRQAREWVQIFRNSPVGLFIIQDRKFKFVNDNFGRGSGRMVEEVIGINPMQLIHPEDRERVRENAIKMLKGERTAPYRYRIIAKDGHVRWTLEGVSSIQFQGQRAVLGQSMDITERVLAEAKLGELYQQEKELRQVLESEVQRRIEFTRALVHELKTPLTPVLSSSELLSTVLHEEPWSSIARDIQRGAQNLSRRIDELLDLARVESGTLKVHLHSVELLELLVSVVDEMSTVASSNGQALALEVNAALPPVWADEERLRQVLMNLLVNATKFTPEGGRIVVRAREKDQCMLVEVQDNGPGIPEEAQQRLFKPYYRQTSDREHLSGLGLGLALCKNLVELQGGQIWVNSQQGAGSIFGFSVPKAVDKTCETIPMEEKVESPDSRG